MSNEDIRTLDTEARLYSEIREEVDRLSGMLDEAKKRLADQTSILFQMIEAHNMKTYPHDELGRLTRTVRTIATVSNKPKLEEYLKEHGMYERFTKLQLRQAELNKLAKKIHDEGIEIPGLDAFDIQGIRFTRKQRQTGEEPVDNGEDYF